MGIIKFIIFICLIVTTALFVYFNPQTTTIDYIVGQVEEISLAALLLIALALGATLVFLLMALKNLWLDRQCAQLTRQNKKLASEVDALKHASEESSNTGTKTS